MGNIIINNNININININNNNIIIIIIIKKEVTTEFRLSVFVYLSEFKDVPLRVVKNDGECVDRSRCSYC